MTLACNVVDTSRSILTFLRDVLPPFSGLMSVYTVL